ncbi:MAG TPA: amidohydrolase family protein [Jiangellaceae bacterium]|nr:amidohydrolase family protein [Jiangellaceae bacterium]
MSIDVHAHCVPTEVIESLVTDGGRYGIEVIQQDGRYAVLIGGRVQTRPILPALLDLPGRIAAMDDTRVEVQVLSSWIDLTAYALDGDAGTRYARMFNEALAATVAIAPERLRGLATVPLQAPERAASELRHAVSSLGLAGVEIATTVDGVELDDQGLEPFWRVAEELRCLVLVHPYASLAGRRVTRYNLANLVGNPAETTIALGHLVFGGVLERHPDLRLCLVHGGGFAPYQIGRWDHAARHDAGGVAADLGRLPSEWLHNLYFDTVLHSPASLRFLLDVVGADHVVLGSDYPFRMGDPEPVGTVEAVAGVGTVERALVLGGNLADILDGVLR